MYKNNKDMYEMNKSCGANKFGNMNMDMEYSYNHNGGHGDYCEKYKKQAQKQIQEANNLKPHAHHTKCEAECLEKHAEELGQKAIELSKEAFELGQKAIKLVEKSEAEWEKYDSILKEMIKLQNDAINNLYRYMECEEGDCPKPPHHGCGGCSCNHK